MTIRIPNADGRFDFSELDAAEIEALGPDQRERLFAFKSAVEAEQALGVEIKSARRDVSDLMAALSLAQADLQKLKPRMTPVQAAREAIETWKRYG